MPILEAARVFQEISNGHVIHSVFFFFAICLKELSLRRFKSGKKFQQLFLDALFCAESVALKPWSFITTSLEIFGFFVPFFLLTHQ